MSGQSNDIVCVSLTPYSNAFTKSTVELCNQLARHHRVLYVNFASSLKDLLKGNGRESWKKVTGLNNRITTVRLPHRGKVHVLTPPPVLPVNWMQPGPVFETLQAGNAALLAAVIRTSMRKLGFTHPIVINAFHPTIGLPLVGKLGEKATVYYCYDDIEAESWSRQHGLLAERAFIQKVDAVIASSREIQRRKQSSIIPCYLLENGVDYSLFQQAFHLPEKRSKPVIGYIGAIDNRLDLQLLAHCIQQHPHAVFQFVGRQPDDTITSFLTQFPNVELHKPVPPSELPAFVRQFDVALIPFKRNEQTRAIYPLKINEYLAAGLPVVSTLFSDLSEFKDVVYLTATTASFSEALSKSLLENDPSKAYSRAEFAKKNSWEERGYRLEELLTKILARSRR